MQQKQKKLLILVDKAGNKKKYYADYLIQKLPNVKVVMANFSDLLFKVSKGEVSVEIDKCSEKIRDFDFVHLRRSGQKYLSQARALALCLNAWGVDFSDKTFADVGPSGNDKFVDGVRLALSGLPVIPFFYFQNETLARWKNQIIDSLGFPFVVKNIYSQRGSGVHLVRGEDELSGLIEKSKESSFLIQKYIPSNEEYRVLILGGEVGCFEQKVNNNPDEFRANVALGATERFMKNDEIPAGMLEISTESCRVLNLDVGGVDILVDKDKNNWLLEVNRGPGLTYDPALSPELDSFAKYFAKKLNEN